jgi:hypothetical protein
VRTLIRHANSGPAQVKASEVQLPVIEQSISLWIDEYDDLFSDFDLRAYTLRNVSDDFLRELKKLSHETEDHIGELKILLPEKLRNKETENVIIKRLHNHFIKNLHYFDKKKKTENKKDVLLSILGFVMMLCAGYISSSKSQSIPLHILLVILEPAGWFLVWICMEHLINSSRKEKPEIEFYAKMTKSRITFENNKAHS